MSVPVGAALNGLTGSGSHLSDSYVQREPEEDRNNLELLTFPPDKDDIKSEYQHYKLKCEVLLFML